jgi:hypothetical protein
MRRRITVRKAAEIQVYAERKHRKETQSEAKERRRKGGTSLERRKKAAWQPLCRFSDEAAVEERRPAAGGRARKSAKGVASRGDGDLSGGGAGISRKAAGAAAAPRKIGISAALSAMHQQSAWHSFRGERSATAAKAAVLCFRTFHLRCRTATVIWATAEMTSLTEIHFLPAFIVGAALGWAPLGGCKRDDG